MIVIFISYFQYIFAIAGRTLPVEMTCASHHGNQAAISKIRPVKLIATASAPDKPASDERKSILHLDSENVQVRPFLNLFRYDRCFLVQIGPADLLGPMLAENEQCSRQIATSQGRAR